MFASKKSWIPILIPINTTTRISSNFDTSTKITIDTNINISTSIDISISININIIKPPARVLGNNFLSI
jgi:hypothetical protein